MSVVCVLVCVCASYNDLNLFTNMLNNLHVLVMIVSQVWNISAIVNVFSKSQILCQLDFNSIFLWLQIIVIFITFFFDFQFVELFLIVWKCVYIACIYTYMQLWGTLATIFKVIYRLANISSRSKLWFPY